MNAQLKTVLLTILTLSVFTIALVELSGVSSTALFNKYGIGSAHDHGAQATDKELAEVQRKEAEAKAMPKTNIEFVEKRHNFGTIKEGDIAKHSFVFKNTGNNPLMVYNVVAGCGCTTPRWSKEIILPGQTGKIDVEFNSSGRPGHQSKNVLVYSNAQEESISIGFDVDVEKK